jgi:hypothetical protein
VRSAPRCWRGACTAQQFTSTHEVNEGPRGVSPCSSVRVVRRTSRSL